MKEQIKAKITGHVKVYNTNTGKVYYDDHNALTVDAQNILAIVIAQVDKLSQIKALKAGLPLATAAISLVTITLNVVKMKAIFSEASFNDTLDELQLMQGLTNIFSGVTGLSIAKDDVTQMTVEWELTITI